LMFLLRDLIRKCLVSGGWPHHGNVALEAMASKLMILLRDLIKEMLSGGCPYHANMALEARATKLMIPLRD